MLNKIKIILFSLVLFTGTGIWLFYNLPLIAMCTNNCWYVTARNCFWLVQVILTSSGIILLYLIFYKNIQWKIIAFSFCLSTILIKFNVFQEIHIFLNLHNMYWDIFKTNNKIDKVISFQYSRIWFLFIISCFFCIPLIWKKNRSIDRIFMLIFAASLFLFTYTTHFIIGRVLFIQYQTVLSSKVDKILDMNENDFLFSCQKEHYQCSIKPEGNLFYEGHAQTKNNLIPSKDSSNDINNVVNEELLIPNQHKTNFKKILLENDIISLTNIRSVLFGLKKQNNKNYILIDYNQLAQALDYYLVFFTINFLIFILIWGVGGYQLIIFHNKLIKKRLT